MKLLLEFRTSTKPFWQLLRFGLSSLGTIAVKIGLTWLFARGLNEYASYFITHVVILFWSYFSHLKFTFNERHSVARFWAYTKAVFLIKCADFLIFSALLQVARDQLSLSILVASLTMNIVRFCTIRKAIGASVQPSPDRPEPRDPV